MKRLIIAVMAMFAFTANAAVMEYNFDNPDYLPSDTGATSGSSLDFTVDGITATVTAGTQGILTGTRYNTTVVQDIDPDNGGLGAYANGLIGLREGDEVGTWAGSQWLTFTFEEDVELAFLEFNNGQHGDDVSNETFDFVIDGMEFLNINMQSSFDTLGFGLTGSEFTIRNNYQGFHNGFKGFYVAGMDVYTGDDIRIASEVPEPSTMALMGLGLAGIAASRRRKKA